MATLTAAQKSYLRDMSGDDCAEYLVSDITLQEIYDDTAQGASDLGYTLVWMLRRIVGKKAKLVGQTNIDTGNNQQLQQSYEHYKELLAYYERMYGLTNFGSITPGVLSLGLDEPCPEGYTCD
jgi:hypothetical protein